MRPTDLTDQPPTAAPAKDLLGDDDEPHAASPPLQDKSAEIGNVKNQLDSTNRSLENARAERAAIERQLTEQAAMLSSLQTQLSSSKAAYDTETKLLSTLKERFATQNADIQKTREELIRSESDLSATKVEKAEIEGALLRDKEEVRDLHRKMAETGALIETTKAEVEKLKKEAKQQKGLLAIAKKQLATRETEKAKADKEMEEAKAELLQITGEREAAEAELNKEEVPAAITNGHISPSLSPQPSLMFAATQPLPTSLPTSPDVSPPAVGKSNNPFERLALSSTPRPESPFMPFAASSTLPTPATTSPEPAVQEAVAVPETAAEDPFGFNQAFASPEPKAEASEPETPKPNVPPPLNIGSPKSQDLLSPADTDLFTTPPTTATGSQHTVSPQYNPADSQFPVLGELSDDDVTSPTPTGPPTATPSHPQLHEADHEDTDLTHELKEIEESDSEDSSSDEDDDAPLATVAAKLTETAETPAHINGTTAPSETSAFDDSFGIASESHEPVQASASAGPADFSSMFDTPAVGKQSPPPAPVPAVLEAPQVVDTPRLTAQRSRPQASTSSTRPLGRFRAPIAAPPPPDSRGLGLTPRSRTTSTSPRRRPLSPR